MFVAAPAIVLLYHTCGGCVAHLVMGARPDSSQYFRSFQKSPEVKPKGPALHSGAGGLAAEFNG